MRFRHAAYATVLALLVAGCDGAGPTASDTPVDGGIRAGRSGLPGPVGTITVVLDVQPSDPQDFSFALTGQKRATLLDDDNDPTLLNTRKYPSLAAGSYTLAIGTVPTGYRLVDLTCSYSSGSNVSPSVVTGTATITLAAGGQVTCTFTVSVSPPPTVTAIPDESNGGFDQGCRGSFTVQFSEAVTGFTASDVSLAGSDVALLSVFQVTGGPSTYTVTVLWGVGSTVVMSVPANAATSVATGKPNVASSNTNNLASISSACAPTGP